MNQIPVTEGSTPRILVATDLSARCDRALERAVLMATDWQTPLTILHVFESSAEYSFPAIGHALPSWRRPPDAADLARQRIRRALHAEVGDAVEHATVLVEDGEPAAVIEQVAAQQRCGIIITGIARESPFASRPVSIGRTVEQLLRRASVPVLIVKDRARSTYEHIVVAADFSEVSGRALQAALRFFPLQTLHLLHAFEAPYASHTSDPAAYQMGYGATLTGDLDSFLGSIYLAPQDRRRLVPLIEHGQPAPLIQQYVRDRGADLVVLGTHGRGAVGEALIGSTAKRILESLPCDALVVRRPG